MTVETEHICPKQRGKVVLLGFWSVDCLPCVTCFTELEQVHRDYRDSGLVVIAVHRGVRDHGRPTQCVKDRHLSFPVAIDNGEGWDGGAFRAYQVDFIPQLWWIDKTGRVRRTGRDLSSKVRLEDLLRE